jgi:hypothetical protein
MTERHRWPTVREMMAESDRGLLDDPTAFKSGFELEEPTNAEAGAEATEPKPSTSVEKSARRKRSKRRAA